MILDENRDWFWTLTELPKLAKGKLVKFNVVEREIGTRFRSSSFMSVDEYDVAYNVSDSNTLLGILFDESLKSKCIGAIDVRRTYDFEPPHSLNGLDVTIVLVQGADNHTNIDSNVLNYFSRIMKR